LGTEIPGIVTTPSAVGVYCFASAHSAAPAARSQQSPSVTAAVLVLVLVLVLLLLLLLLLLAGLCILFLEVFGSRSTTVTFTDPVGSPVSAASGSTVTLQETPPVFPQLFKFVCVPSLSWQMIAIFR
jgi:hypothetical protein